MKTILFLDAFPSTLKKSENSRNIVSDLDPTYYRCWQGFRCSLQKV